MIILAVLIVAIGLIFIVKNEWSGLNKDSLKVVAYLGSDNKENFDPNNFSYTTGQLWTARLLTFGGFVFVAVMVVAIDHFLIK